MPAHTPTVTITPSAGNGSVGFRCAPVGESMGFVPSGAPVEILDSQEIVNGVEWIQVRDNSGWETWVSKAVHFIRA